MRNTGLFVIAMSIAIVACGKENNVVVGTTPVCALGQYNCKGDVLQVCNAVGSGFDDVTTCPAGTCVQGASDCRGDGGGAGTGGAAGDSGAGGSTGGTGSSSGSGGGTASGGTEGSGTVSPECVGTQLTQLVGVTGGFSIDATEVTRCQYEVWLASTPPTTGQVSYCGWNKDYGPSCEWPANGKGKHPVVCVDWCDANAYCKSVGRRLCGQIGGGAIATDDVSDPVKSQWYAACSAGGQNDYPYGDTYQPYACNGYDAQNGGTVEVGTMPDCQSPTSGYEGVYDLSGNVWEWTDSCGENTGNLDMCPTFGGSTLESHSGHGVDFRCAGVFSYLRASESEHTGFRCCSDP